MRKAKITFSVSLLTLLLTACGGGGGGGGNSSNVNRDTMNNTATPVMTSSASGTASAGSAATASDRGSTASSASSGSSSGNTARSPRSPRSPRAPADTSAATSAAVTSGRTASSVDSADTTTLGSGTAVTSTTAPPTTAPPTTVTATPSVPPLVAATTTPPKPVPPKPVPPAVSPPPPPVPPPTSGGRVSVAGTPDRDYRGALVLSDAGFISMNSLHRSSGSYSTPLVSITVEREKAIVTLKKTGSTSDVISIDSHERNIKELKDTDGTLLGFYGSVKAISTEKERKNGSGTEKYPMLDIFYAIDNNKATLPVKNNVQYQGSFLYAMGAAALNETTDAVFAYKDKRITGSIRHFVSGAKRAHWVIPNASDVNDNSVSVDDATFNVRLRSQLTGVRDGTMSGGFFGKEGQIMVAQAESTGNDPSTDAWAGVFVGNQREIPKP